MYLLVLLIINNYSNINNFTCKHSLATISDYFFLDILILYKVSNNKYYYQQVDYNN